MPPQYRRQVASAVVRYLSANQPDKERTNIGLIRDKEGGISEIANSLPPVYVENVNTCSNDGIAERLQQDKVTQV